MAEPEFACNTPSALYGDTPDVLTRIYNEGMNLAVWQRSADSATASYAGFLTEADTRFSNLRGYVSADKVHEWFLKSLPEHPARTAFTNDVALICDMFCCLFELKAVGIRLTVLDKAMCPKFHTDQVPCRLVTSYYGEGTEWLQNYHVNRHQSGYGKINDRLIQKIKPYHVALLKGESWEGNENNGVVHRSPVPETDGKRVLLTLDFAD